MTPDPTQVGPRRRKSWSPKFLAIAEAAIALSTSIYYFARQGAPDKSYPTFPARPGPLDITVLEGGGAGALESQEVKSEVNEARSMGRVA